MTLRLTSSSSLSSSTSCGNPMVDQLLQDPTISVPQKTDCIQTLQVVLKNLMDPIKSQDVKYRTLKRDNVKLQQKLFCTGIETYVVPLLEGPCGFHISSTTTTTTTTTPTTTTPDDDSNTTNNNNTYIVPSPPTDFTRQSILKPLQDALGLARAQLTAGNVSSMSTTSTTITNTPATTTTTTANSRIRPFPPVPEKLSEKQKARKLLQEKEEMEKEIARRERQRQIALLQQDKLTRETDPNWKPSLSAACAKSGSSISTFRDKYGEH